MSLRLTSGILKGQSLLAPATEATRPTGVKTRQAVANMLAPFVEGEVVLELFAGSGAVGLEALSRGGRGAVFVENHPAALRALRENVAEAGKRALKAGVSWTPFAVVSRDVAAALADLKGHGPFGIIWADPPYKDAATWAQQLATPLFELASSEAIFGFESDLAQSDAVQQAVTAVGWDLWKQKKYGETMVTLFLRKATLEKDVT